MKSKAIFSASILLICISSSCGVQTGSQPVASPTIATAAEYSTAIPTLPAASTSLTPASTALPPAPTALPAIGLENLDQLFQLHAYGDILTALFGPSFMLGLSTFPVAYSPDGRYVALGGCTEFFNGGESGRLYCGKSHDPSDDESAKSFTVIVDATTEEVIARLPDNEPDTAFTDLAFMHDGSKLFFTLYHPDRSELMVWDTASERTGSPLWSGLGYPSVAISPDDHWLALDNMTKDEPTGKVEVFDLTNDQVITELPGGFWAPQFSGDGQKLAVAPHGKFSIYDTSSWTLDASFNLPCELCFLALSPDLSLLATSDAEQQDAPVLIWDIATGQQLHSLPPGEDFLNFLYFTPDGSMLWDFMYGAKSVVWDTGTWQPVGSRYLFQSTLDISDLGTVRSIQFADDDRSLLLETESDVYLAGLPTADQEALLGTVPAPTPLTTQPFQMPAGRLLLSTDVKTTDAAGSGKTAQEFYVLNLPDQTIEPFPALNPGAPAENYLFSASPDTRSLAFARRADVGDTRSALSIYLLGPDSTAPVQIVQLNNSECLETISWSLDGRVLAFGGVKGQTRPCFDTTGTFIDLYDIESGSLKRLSPRANGSQTDGARTLALSPTGDQIAFSTDNNVVSTTDNNGVSHQVNTGGDLFLMNSDGTNEQLLLPGWSFAGMWDPDGTALYYSKSPNGVYRYDLSSGAQTLIVNDGWNYVLSPDGTLLAVLGESAISFIKLETQTVLPLSIPGYYDILAWSSDSRHVAINATTYGTCSGPCTSSISIVDVETGGKVEIHPSVDLLFVLHGWLP